MRLDPDHLRWNAPKANDMTVVYFAGCKDLLGEQTFQRALSQLRALANEPIESELVLDFGNVEYVSGLALGMLVSLHKRLHAGGRLLTIRNLRPHVHEVFTVTRLDKLLNLQIAQPRA